MATTVPFIDFDGFGFLDDSDECNDIQKLSPEVLQLKKQQPPISPIESESSSGISSLDSDDLKKQLLSSPPTISISHDEEEEEEEPDRGSNSDNIEKEKTDSGTYGDDEELVNNESGESDDKENNDKQKLEIQSSESQNDIKDSMASVVSDKTPSPTVNNSPEFNRIPISPTQVMFHNRDILNLSINTGNSGKFIQYTVLPENNISCFFQNRAQYWRLGNGDEKEIPDAMIKCSCCDFTFPSINNNQQSQQGHLSGKNKNPITDSLLTFLKNHHADYNNFNTSPNSINANNNINNMSCAQNNIINANNGMKRMYNNNNNAPYIAYQMMQQQQQQQYANNGFYANGMNGWNNHAPPPLPQSQQQMNNGYNGTALAILNLMNPPRNSAGAFQAMNNNTSRYYNNINTNKNGFGLYKQF